MAQNRRCQHPTRRELIAALTTALGCQVMPQSGMRSVADPYALVLGTAQDGGLPQIGCYTERCETARSTPRFVSSLALIEPNARRYYLVDATPDITRQVDLIQDEGFRRRAQERRPFDGIFLTHAHIGHYLGLALLGREGLGTAETPVYCSETMANYLATNGPWSLLVDEGRIVFPEVPVDQWLEVDEWLAIRMIPVPHRPEFSDTVAFMFRGPNASILYLPDIDRWESWQYDISDIASQVNAALLDGSFYSGTEVPGRRIEDIPHPLIPHTMDLLEPTVSNGARILFTHLNNTNPAHDDSAVAATIRERGFEIARQGMRLPL